MTKYNKEALDAAEDSVAFSRYFTDRAVAAAVFDSLERAPWWEPIEPGYLMRIGEPFRFEHGGVSKELIQDREVRFGAKTAWFRDTRWTPPAKPLKVGDLIDTKEQAESLPIGTIAVSRLNAPIRKANTDEWRRVDKEDMITDSHMAGYGDRIIYLPSGDSK